VCVWVGGWWGEGGRSRPGHRHSPHTTVLTSSTDKLGWRISAPLAAALVRGGVEAATRALRAGVAFKGADALFALRPLLAC
jgi:hypothetical protein